MWAWWLLEALARCRRSRRSFSFSTKLVLVPVLVEGTRVSRLWARGWSLGGMGGGGGGAGLVGEAGAAIWVGIEMEVGLAEARGETAAGVLL